jgi:hypothetical protein
MACHDIVCFDLSLFLVGEMREWLNRAVSKTVEPLGFRGFESLSLRKFTDNHKCILLALLT